MLKEMRLEKDIFIAGADPEIMIRDRKSNALKSATSILTGSKHEPQKVKNGAVLSDNVNLEFNTKPAKTAKEFVDTIEIVLNESLKLIGKDDKLVILASANFPKEALEDPRTQEFGCEPDYDAWKLVINKVSADAASKTFRSAGGHIHVGMTSKSKKLLSSDLGRVRVIRTMDLVLGIISVILDKDPSSIPRRELYGKAGSNRPKPYGVEYRALGPFWIASKELVYLMHSLTSIAVQICLNNVDEELIKLVGEKKIVNTINKSDIKEARTIYTDTLSKILPKDIVEQINKLEGVEFDFYKSWGLPS